MLNVALPKGRLGEKVYAMFAKAGFEVVVRDIKEEITRAFQNACARYGFGYVALSAIEKVHGHPTELGMAQICEQILAFTEQ